MTGIFTNKFAAAARGAGLAAVFGTAAAASVVGLAGAAQAAPAPNTNQVAARYANLAASAPAWLQRHHFGATPAAPGAPTPSANHRDGMYGNPAAAAPYWRRQHASDCGEMAAADVIGQITGHEPTEPQITAVAESIPSGYGPGPMYNPPGGTDYRNLPKLLAHYGIQSNVVGTDTSALEQDLAGNRKVIVLLNGETIWNQPGKRTYPDHFVVLTGIDTKAGVVHLNDSGLGTGRDEQVPIATFEQAWATSHDTAVVTK